MGDEGLGTATVVTQGLATAHISILGNGPGRVLEAEHLHGVGGGPQEGDARFLAALRELLVFAQEAVSRVHRHRPAVRNSLRNGRHAVA